MSRNLYSAHRSILYAETGEKVLVPTPEHPAPASRSGQDSYVSKGGPLGGLGSCWQSDQLLNTEDGKERGVWSTLVMEEGTSGSVNQKY